MMTSTSLPSARRSQKRPSEEPRLSPSGRMWEVIAKRFLFSMSSTTWLSIKSKDEGGRMKDEAALGHLIHFHSSSVILNPFTNGFHLLEQGTDAFRLLFHCIAYKVKRGSVPQVQRKAELFPDIRRRVLQRAQGTNVFLLIARDRNINAGVAQVIGDANFRHRDQSQARVLQLVTHDLR